MRFHAALALLAAAVLAPAGVHAAAFELAVAPSRVVISGEAGGRIGQSVTLINVGNNPTEIAVRTLDWEFAANGNISYFDELRPDSCRPWVTLERRFVRLHPRGRAVFRFQVDVPREVSRRECRFMLAVEGVEPAYRAHMQSGGASLSLPVSGRIAIAVYVLVNGAEPRLEIQGLGVREAGGQRQPVLTVVNLGDAHGRLDGGLEAVDASGAKFELVPEGTPVMPGQTRVLVLQPRTEGQRGPPAALKFPIRTEGRLDWELGSFRIRTEFR